VGQSPVAPIKNDEIAAMLRCSSLHMNNYASPRALPDANLVVFNEVVTSSGARSFSNIPLQPSAASKVDSRDW
jgi:hypothetical protein